jgi:hypothetical protein
MKLLPPPKLSNTGPSGAKKIYCGGIINTSENSEEENPKTKSTKSFQENI